jgi:hypothetical protein
MALDLNSAMDGHADRRAHEGAAEADSFRVAVLEGQSVVVRVNGGADVGARPRLNFVPGANISLLGVDDSVQSEIEITIALSANPDVSGEYRVDGVRVVGNRKTGWTLPTGTATRTGFDTSTATVTQLAEAFKALIEDLHANAGHGLIGS